MSKKLFITGTGTDVGKTFVTALIVKKLHQEGRRSAYYKAAMSGNTRSSDGTLIPNDALYVKTIAGIDQSLDEMCPYIYESAVSPHLASRIEGNPVDFSVIKRDFYHVCSKYDYITMEGSGGIVCPICYDKNQLLLEDVIKKLDLSCLIVANSGLGTINNVVLTVNYMRAKSIPIKGIIFNFFHPEDVMEEDNLKMCEYLTGLKVLTCVKYGDENLQITADNLASLYE